ncbi:hypothetical protein L3X37_09850 [Sabulilitoribacter arenilitoris]|uniref:Uncharacterized protein n=1 Tax=Wocania arenilitoris TaxID=2044858 RepID=A0AAE3EPS9_9FLAO|nr:hypothetical protein [Wocania arenilitoris]MCF7568668.1 hypothetical protein [Wocania arenilitoris]
MTSEKSKSQIKTSDNKNIVIGSILATLIAITPYLFYLYESVPDEKVWNTFLFDYNSGFYESANVGMWVLTGKLIPLYLLFLWFFTCRHWWYHTLLVPIAMYSYQTFDLLNKEVIFFDSGQLIYLIPIMAIIIPSIYLIRARIFNRINEVNKSLEELEEEFKVSPKNFWGKIKEYF